MEKELLKKCAINGFLLDKKIIEVLDAEEEEVRSKFVKFICSIGISSKIISPKTLKEEEKKINVKLQEISALEIIQVFNRIGIFVEGQKEENKNPKYSGIPLKILSAPVMEPKQRNVEDFVSHFRSRYEILKEKLAKENIENMTTIRKIKNMKGAYTIVGMVLDKRVTKSKNIILEVEDATGTLNVLINRGKKDVYNVAKEVLFDEVLTLDITNDGKFVYCEQLRRPSIKLPKIKEIEDDVWLVLISDIHVGSINFMEENFTRFIRWINEEEGVEEWGDIIKKIKYIFIAGDIVDGIGIYPDQEKNLSIKTLEGQYKKFYEYIKLLRKDIRIIACPGYHDASWVGDPQAPIFKKWAESLCKMENLSLVSSPSLLEIIGGLKVMLYHGKSMFNFMDELPSLRLRYKLTSPSVYIEEMLKRGHLSPMHGIVDYIPTKEDVLAIKNVPDIILSGYVHRAETSIHNNILAVSGSCWQRPTQLTEELGQSPVPCRVVLLNLKTRETKIVDFSKDKVTVEAGNNE